MGKHAFPPLPTRPQLVAVNPALLYFLLAIVELEIRIKPIEFVGGGYARLSRGLTTPYEVLPIGTSVCLSVPPSVRPSIRPSVPPSLRPSVSPTHFTFLPIMGF